MYIQGEVLTLWKLYNFKEKNVCELSILNTFLGTIYTK